jgi:WD40 repeat protein
VAVPGPGIHTLTLARGGRRLAVASKVAVYLWEDLADPVLWPVYKIRARDSAAHLIALAPDGITLVVAREGHQVQLVDLVSGQVTREFYSIRDWPCALALAPDGGTLALATGFANFIQLFHLPEGRLFRCLHGHRNVICDLAFSADGGRHASGSADGTARVWDTVTWQPVALLEPEDDSYPMAPASG